jgi:Family of unknown function (DUF6459)
MSVVVDITGWQAVAACNPTASTRDAMPVQEAVHVRNDGISSQLFALPDLAPPTDDAPGKPARRLDADLTGRNRWPAQDASTRSGPADGGQPAGPDDWPLRLARMITEALAGSRPARQVLPWTNNRARRQLQRMRPAFGAGQRPRIVRVLSTRPACGVIEMSVIAGFGPRTRALALRLEWLPGPQRGARWICTEIEAA